MLIKTIVKWRGQWTILTERWTKNVRRVCFKPIKPTVSVERVKLVMHHFCYVMNDTVLQIMHKHSTNSLLKQYTVALHNSIFFN